jgi:hypothetical protein
MAIYQAARPDKSSRCNGVVEPRNDDTPYLAQMKAEQSELTDC